MRITIVGEAPSKSSDPARPFCGYSGKWLAKMAGMSGYEELAENARLVNVFRRWPGKGYAGEKGSRFNVKSASRVIRKRIEFVGIVLLAGRRVAASLDPKLAKVPYFSWHQVPSDLGRCWVVVIPHPSGYWNYEENRSTARNFFNSVFG